MVHGVLKKTTTKCRVKCVHHPHQPNTKTKQKNKKRDKNGGNQFLKWEAVAWYCLPSIKIHKHLVLDYDEKCLYVSVILLQYLKKETIITCRREASLYLLVKGKSPFVVVVVVVLNYAYSIICIKGNQIIICMCVEGEYRVCVCVCV